MLTSKHRRNLLSFGIPSIEILVCPETKAFSKAFLLWPVKVSTIFGILLLPVPLVPFFLLALCIMYIGIIRYISCERMDFGQSAADIMNLL